MLRDDVTYHDTNYRSCFHNSPSPRGIGVHRTYGPTQTLLLEDVSHAGFVAGWSQMAGGSRGLESARKQGSDNGDDTAGQSSGRRIENAENRDKEDNTNC